MAAAAFETSAPPIEGCASDPTLQIVVDVASTSAEVAPRGIVGTELDAPPFKPTIRFAPWLIACAALGTMAFATWLFASNASRTAAPPTPQTPGTSVSSKPPGTSQEIQVGPQVEPAPSKKQEALVGTGPSTPTLARERPATSTPALGAQPQATDGARFKGAATHTQGARTRKPAPKLFIPNDI
jgi:hypothetical protein